MIGASRHTSLALVTAVALLCACGSARRGDPLVGRMELSDPVLVRGQIAYARACDACHPGGEGGLGPSLNDKPLPVWLMRFQVRHGLGVMPAFPEAELSVADLDALLAYEKARRAMAALQSPAR